MARNDNIRTWKQIRGEKAWPAETPFNLTVGGTLATGAAGEFLGVIAQDDEPVLTTYQWCIWVDTDGASATYLVAHNGTANVKVALV